MTLLISPNSTAQQSSPLLGKTLAELTEWVQQQGQPAYRGKQLHEWIYQKGVRSLNDISVFPKQWRTELESVEIGRSALHYRSCAPDGTVKFLLRLSDGAIIEAVGIPSYREKESGVRGQGKDRETRGRRDAETERQKAEGKGQKAELIHPSSPIPHSPPSPASPSVSPHRLVVQWRVTSALRVRGALFVISQPTRLWIRC